LKTAREESVTPVPESVLVDRVAAGDRGALESLYHSYYGRLAHFLRRSIGRTDGVEEIINDTFMEVWNSAQRSRSGSITVSTWVFGIAYGKAVADRSRPQSPAVRFNARHSSSRFIDSVSDAETNGELRRALETLSFEERSTLVLAYQMGCALEEIAAITGVPIGSVRARLLDAREKVRGVLGADKEAHRRAVLKMASTVTRLELD
jgi:RNA polymerase sigma-70 factor (ECF subfamily)